MYQEACFPSLTASTVVAARPARSPPHQTLERLVCIVSLLTSGRDHWLNLMGDIALMTKREK